MVKATKKHPPTACQPPACLAKTKAITSIDCVCSPRPTVPVAEVVTLTPLFPLKTPNATAAVVLLTMGLNKDSDYDEDGSNSEQLSKICGQRIAGRKSTGLFDCNKDLGLGDFSDFW